MTSSNKNNTFLVVKAKGGMGNRMLCAVTGILYGELTNRRVIIDWRDATYSNDHSNTFFCFFKCPNVYSETVLEDGAVVWPDVWKNNLDRSISEMISRNDPDKHNSITIHHKYSVDIRKLDYYEDIIVFWYYTGRIRNLRQHLSNGLNGYGNLAVNEIIRKVLTEKMVLQPDIRRRIDDFKAKYWSDKVIGIHIRNTDRKTNLAQYEKHLQKFLKRFPDAHIFLATDNLEVSREYCKRFKKVFSTPKWYPKNMASMHQNISCPDKVVNGIEALVDMYLLAECDCLIYSAYSTFSFVSMALSNAQPENIADIDRFNVKVRLKKLIRELAM